MTSNVTNLEGGNKTAELSNPGKLLRAYMQATGVFDAKQLAQVLDIPIRTIQRLRLEVATCANSANDAISGASSVVVIAPAAPDMALSASHVPARVEETNLLINLVSTVEIKESNILLRSDEPKPKKQIHGTRLDLDWTLSADLRQWTRTTFPQTTPDRLAAELETFRDYWASVAGQKGRKADWDATWRNWSRRSFATAPMRPNAQPPPMSASAARTARMRAMLREGISA